MRGASTGPTCARGSTAAEYVKAQRIRTRAIAEFQRAIKLGSAATEAKYQLALALERGASVFRVHDVAPVRDGLAVAAATVRPAWGPPTSTTMRSTRTS